VDNYGVRVLDLSKVGYKDDMWILANCVAHVFYAEYILSKNEKKSTNKTKHVVFQESNKHLELTVYRIWRIFNQFSDMSLFVDDPVKIKNIERSIPQSSLPWVRPDG